ncbi:MAG: iron ABC transporter permease [bacterium]
MIKKFFVLIFVGLIAILLITLISLCIGSYSISLNKIIQVILDGKRTTEHTILFDIRLPRVILGFAIGSSLALSGAILQGLFRNPLVEPYTLGISGGSALAVCLSIVLSLSLPLPLSGFLGASFIIFILYFLSARNRIVSLPSLLLLGVMISFISGGLIMLIMAISKHEDLQGIIFWIMGSLEEPNWSFINLALFSSIIGLFISFFFSQSLNAFCLGEEKALNLGIDTEKTKKVLFLISSLLVGFSVSVSGIIGFVGLVVPHIARFILGWDYRFLLISSWLLGGGFLILCDTIARTIIAPYQLPVGVITGIIGGLLFSYFLIRNDKGRGHFLWL